MPKKQSDEIRAVLVESARVQVAALDAAIEFWGGWIEAARDFAQTASKELERIEQEDIGADPVIGRMTDASRAFLRRMTDLPDMAVARFNSDIERVGASKKPTSTRSARAKE
jgi:hypothetical protein